MPKTKKARREGLDDLPRLRKLAQQEATAQGHTLSRFKAVINRPGKYVSDCRRCGRLAVVSITVDPLPSRYGQALQVACPGERSVSDV